MNKFCYLLFSLFVTLQQLQAQNDAVDLAKKITVDGLEREYLIHLPPGYAPNISLPVIFALHGGGGNYENTIALYNLNVPADQHNFIVVYPNALNKSWSMKGVGSFVKENRQDIDDVKFISILMDTLVTYYHADPSSFFCTGLSRGGIFSLFLADKLSSRIKAIAPVCASIPQSIIGDYSFQHPTPVLLINGTEDPLIPFEGGHGPGRASKQNEENHFIPTHELVHKIKTLNHCPELSVAHHMPNQEEPDVCTAVKTSYDCSGTPFVFIKIMNGGHTWPGGRQYLPKAIIGNVCNDFKAEEEIVNFFLSVR